MITEQLDRLARLLTGLWKDFDELMETLDSDRWNIRHGPDWILADVPFHLGYFDDLVASFIAQGETLPEGDRLSLGSLAEMATWNETEFARRPANLPPGEAVAAMRTARKRILETLDGLTDADLERAAWNHLLPLRGWRSVRAAVETCILHTWNEFVQFRHYLGREVPEPDAELTRFCVGGFVAYFQAFLDPAAAAEHRLTIVYAFPDAGTWTVRIADGASAVSEGGVDDADLVLTQAYATFMKTFNGMIDPGEAIGSGAIMVAGMEHLPVFAALYPPPEPGKIVPAFP